MEGAAKTVYSDREGIYILQPDTVNDREHWLQLENLGEKQHALWYDPFHQNWKIAPKDFLGSSNSLIVSNVNNSTGPLEAATWNYSSSGIWYETTEKIILSAGNIFEIQSGLD